MIWGRLSSRWRVLDFVCWRNVFVFLLEMSLECWPRLHILSMPAPSTGTYDCWGLGPHRVFPGKNHSSDFILQQRTFFFKQKAVRRCSLSASCYIWLLYFHCHVDPHLFCAWRAINIFAAKQMKVPCMSSQTSKQPAKPPTFAVLSFSLCVSSPDGSWVGKVTQEECEMAIGKAQHFSGIRWWWEAVVVVLRHVCRSTGYLPSHGWPSFPCLPHIHSVVVNLASFQRKGPFVCLLTLLALAVF